ncbi:MAG: hypothetical protein ISS16_01250 [Ignavibacteria bacterium]|nr:hypothetical protein [Ignavibacteria bacterium]
MEKLQLIDNLKQAVQQQVEITGQQDFLDLPYHKAILNREIPLNIGGGIGQEQTCSVLCLTFLHCKIRVS